LDARVVTYWRLHSLINSGLLLGLGLAAGGFIVWILPETRFSVATVLLAFLLVRLGVLLWYPARAYRAWGFRVDEKVLELREGVWFKVVILLPLSRLQHVDLHCGPLERFFGLATLVFHTAGTHHAVIVLPGLEAEEAGRLRDELVAAGGDDAV
jgi:uncharacterized protein